MRNFTFDNIPAEQALFKLTEEAGITLVAKDAPYPALYGKNLNGSFKEVVEMVSHSADLFYRYDAKTNSLILSRRASFTLTHQTPERLCSVFWTFCAERELRIWLPIGGIIP